jgi:hypothetical protein
VPHELLSDARRRQKDKNHEVYGMRKRRKWQPVRRQREYSRQKMPERENVGSGQRACRCNHTAAQQKME